MAIVYRSNSTWMRTKKTARKHSGGLPMATKANPKQEARKRNYQDGEDERDPNLDADGESTRAQKQPEPARHSKCM